MEALQRGQGCLPLHSEQGTGTAAPVPDSQIALGSLSCSVTFCVRYGWAASFPMPGLDGQLDLCRPAVPAVGSLGARGKLLLAN